MNFHHKDSYHKTQWLESHTAYTGSSVVKKNAFVKVTRKRSVSVAEEDVIDFLSPCWQDVVEMVRDSLHGGSIRKMMFMKAP